MTLKDFCPTAAAPRKITRSNFSGIWIGTDATFGQGRHEDTGEGSQLPEGAVPVPHPALHRGHPREPQDLRQTLLRVRVRLRFLHGARQDDKRSVKNQKWENVSGVMDVICFQNLRSSKTWSVCFLTPYREPFRRKWFLRRWWICTIRGEKQ